MSNRLPDIFLNSSSLLGSEIVKKKQGGIFELNLDKSYNKMNETFTLGFVQRHKKTYLNKKNLRDTENNYRTLTLRKSHFSIDHYQRPQTRHISLYRSARHTSFSLQKNPEAFQGVK